MYQLNQNLSKLNWIIFLALIGLILSNNFEWLAAIIIAISVIALQLSQKDEIPQLEVNRITKGKNFKEGDIIDMAIRVKNTTEIPFNGEIFDAIPPDSSVREGTNVFLLRVPSRQEVVLKYKISFQRRGKYVIGPISFRHISLGGVHEARWTEEIYKEIVVVPVPENVSTYSIPPNFLMAIGGLFRSKLVGDGMDFSGVREYRVGDPLNKVNWKQTAKYHSLHSNEFELNRSSRFILVLDLTEESREIADSSVRAALGLADYLINSRSRVGIMTMSEYVHFIPPKSGKRHLLEITQHLTTAESTGQLRDPELFQKRLNSTIARIGRENNEVVLFSSLNRPENAKIFSESLIRLGSITILSPSGISLPQETNRRFDFARRLLFLRKNTIRYNLLVKGIKVYEWNPELPFENSIRSWRYDR